jgi:pyruvate dehydrogenase E1 component
MAETLDGDWQRYTVEDGAAIREEFFGVDPRLRALVEHLSDEDLVRLRMGGHDYRKLYAAYHQAVHTTGAPTAILARTVKGWTLGEGFEARNMTHQMKKLSREELRVFRDRLELPIPDSDLDDAPYYHPGPQSEEVEYLLEHRRALGGPIPQRRTSAPGFTLPKEDLYAEFHEGTGPKVPVSTTMAFVRLLRTLLKDPEIGPHIVPIVPDEARTFGMESLFREFKIYAAQGQKYTPVDHDVLLKYAESADGRILEEGITEAGSMASFTAAGTSYSTTGHTTVPFYIFYSMFGFQRVGDAIWAFADSRGRGFLLGATYGRTTLNGEGLQHQDGHSLLTASTVPNCLAYDPAFHFETAVIVEEGLRRMYSEQEDIFYYLTLYNENYEMPSMPKGAREGILRGMYRFRKAKRASARMPRATLFGSGVMVQEALRAQEILRSKYSVAADVYSVPSYGELAREATDIERHRRLNPEAEPRESYLETQLAALPEGAPIVATTDSLRAVPEQIARWVHVPFVSLGTDGFGRSDTREALRRFYETDAEHQVYAVLLCLARQDQISMDVVREARQELHIDEDGLDPAHTDELESHREKAEA